MTPEEAEALIRRIPDLQPPPDLESRLPHGKRFPAWTALVASVMFGLGILWLTLGPSRPGAPLQADEIRIRIDHEGACAASPCTDEQHWKASPFKLDAGKRIVIQSVAGAPWGAVRRVMKSCAEEKRYQVEWAMGAETRKIRIPEPPPPRAPEKVILEEIRICLLPGSRRVGHRMEAATVDELMDTIRAMIADYKKAGKTEWPIFIDAAPEVPWREVIQIVDRCAKEQFDRVELWPGPPQVVLAAGGSPKPRGQSAESKLDDVQKELDAGRVGGALDLLADMITLYPDSSSTVRAFTRVSGRRDGTEEPEIVRTYRKKYVLLGPTVYDALLKPRNLVTRQGTLDPNAMGKSPEEINESIRLYMEQGYMQRELGKNGQKFQFDNASTVFSNLLRVLQQQTEPWWIAKYDVLATLVDRGEVNDLKLARVGLQNIERSIPDFDGNKYGLKERFLKLKKKIDEGLLPK